MKPGYAVIGANFGDEAKGSLTAFLSDKFNAKRVVRFNGGAQAGHTVKHRDMRHVFNSFGSNSFKDGNHTYLGSEFILNPLALVGEFRNLRDDPIHASPRVSMHSNCRISLPWDMKVNQALEMSRGAGRHGSCGMGINETVTRQEFVPLTVRDVVLSTVRDLADKLYGIIMYVERRLEELGLEEYLGLFDFNDPEFGVSSAAGSCESYAIELKRCLADVSAKIVTGGLDYEPTIFEGAQGLQLDQELGTFPHVTRSYTGLYGAVKAAIEVGVDQIHPVYITRAYVTRHGNGPLRGEGTIGPFMDLTNEPNPWQGSLRFAPLDLQAMQSAIKRDMLRSQILADGLDVKLESPVIAISCMDHLRHHTIPVYNAEGEKVIVRPSHLPEFVEAQLGLEVRWVSNTDDYEQWTCKTREGAYA